MASDDWYRNIDWNSKIEEEFYAKLNRARSQRDQYMVIQALTLVNRHPKISLRLIDEYFDSRMNKFHDVMALLARAEAYLALDEIDNAVYAYRAVLDQETKVPNHLTTAYVDYPYFVAIHNVESEFNNAIKVLNENIERLMFPKDHYKWHAAKALIHSDKDEAVKALEAAQIKKSGFRFHPNVGLVGKEHRPIIKELLKLSS